MGVAPWRSWHVVKFEDEFRALAVIMIAKSLKDTQEQKDWKAKEEGCQGEHAKIISRGPRL